MNVNKIDKHNIEDIIALTPMQQGMLFHYIKNPDSREYFEQVSIGLDGEINAKAVKAAWKHVVQKNEMLRAVYRWDKLDSPVQIILKEHELPIRVMDLSNIEGDRCEALKRIIKEDKQAGIDIANEPMRVILACLSPKRYQMIISNHHIIYDGWSNGIILREFIDTYEQVYKGIEPKASPKTKFKEYINWLKYQHKESQKIYWKSYLEGYVQTAGLPMRMQMQTSMNKIEKSALTISKEATAAIKQLCKTEKISIATILNTAWGILLQRYNNMEDVVFGTTVSGRTSEIKDVENTVGLFINTIPMRVKSQKDENITALLKRIEGETRERAEYESTSLADIRALMENKNSNAMFDTLLVIDNYPLDKGIRENHVIRNIEIETTHIETSYDIALGIILSDEIVICGYYNRFVYDEKTIQRAFRHYENIIKQIACDSGKTVEAIDFIDEEEKEQIIFSFNNTKIDYPAQKTVHKLFEEQVERTPDSIAVSYGSNKLTYRELNERANQLAHLLIKKNILPDKIVGIMLERSIEMPIAVYGVLKAGGTYLPIDPNYPRNRIMTMLNNSDCSILITKEGIISAYPFIAIQSIKVNESDFILSRKREQIKDFDHLPIPDRTLVDYEKYSKYIGQAMVKNSIAIQATRGCPYNCAYCHKLWPKSHIVRSAESIFNEVKLYYQQGIRRFVFVDDIFNLNESNSSRFFRMIIENNMKIQIFFPQGLRGDILTKEYIDLMVQAGVVSLALALETASPRLQKLIGKNLHLSKLKENIEYICTKYPELILELFTMHGFPSETEEEAKMTMDFIKSIKWMHFPYIHVLKIYPETDMARIAIEHGITKAAIESSLDTAYHQLSETTPFSNEFTKMYQTEFLNDYFLNKERLLKVLPLQMKILTEDELIQKYNSYLPWEINSFKGLLEYMNINEAELRGCEFVSADAYKADGFNNKIRKYFPEKLSYNSNALRILFLDLSQYFSTENEAMLYDVVEPPLGFMYLLSYLNHKLGSQILGTIAKARIDFDSYHQLHQLLKDFQPDVICVRSLTYYRSFFHKAISLIRQWGIDVPVIAGGPYATSSYEAVLSDRNIDMVILGEGEITLLEVVEAIIKNNKQLPEVSELIEIPGIAVQKPEASISKSRELLMLDHADALLEKEAVHNPVVKLHRDNSIYQIYTSGSTGIPKGALVKHHSFTNLVSWYIKDFNLSKDDNMLLVASTSFDLAQKNLYATLLMGGQLHLFESDSYDYAKMSQVIEEKNITIINCTPSAFYPLLEANEDNSYLKLKSLRYVFLGGEPINISRFSDWFASRYCNCTVVNTYGPTECTDVISSYIINKQSMDMLSTIPIGKPVHNTNLYVLDSKLRILPIGAEGELYVGGVCVGRGYYKDEQLTEQRFIEVDHLPDKLIYKTGDIAKWLEDGNLEFIGRADNQVKVRGFRIETGEIEAKLLQNKNIKEAAAVVREEGGSGAYICAYIVSDCEIESSEIVEQLSHELPNYMIPSCFVRIDKLPLTPSGKVDKKSLPDPSSSMAESNNYIAPSSEIETKLAEIWCRVLSLKQIGIHDNFFDLGGHSLMAVQAINLIYKLLNIKLSIQEFFSHQTIAAQAQFISNNSKVEYEQIQKLPDKAYYDLSFAQMRLWIINQKEPLNTAYNISGSIEFNEKVSESDVEGAFTQLIQRHESFRTCIRTVNGEPKQIIAEDIAFKAVLEDLSSLDEADRKIEAARIYKALSESVFNLAEPPLIAASLLKLSEERYKLLLCMHHIISDGWSMHILKKEFMDIYEACKNKKALELEPLMVQYKDFAEWQNKQIEGSSRMEAAKAYWYSQLKDQIPPPIISGRYEGGQSIDHAGAVYSAVIGKEAKDKLKTVMRKENTTLYNVLLSALNILLADLTGEQDIIIGTAGSGREHENLQGIMGYFINTIVLRNHIEYGESFKNLLQRVNANTLNALEYQSFPLEKIVEELNISYPQITVFFNLLSMEETEKLSISDKNADKFEETKDTKFHITLYVREYSDGIEIMCTYIKSLFKPSRIEYMINRYAELINNIAEKPQGTIENLFE